jgi:predicted transposase/invertase (TIGR01784 family)
MLKVGCRCATEDYGEAVMVPGIDPKVDIVFKRLFGTEANADLLIDLLNAVLHFPPDHAVAAVEILNPFNDTEALDDKLSILDVKARDRAGRQFNVEMQVLPYAGYPKRIVYYLTKLHQQQLHQGEAYLALAPSYSISFLDHVLFPDRPRWHWRFELRDLAEPGVVFTDQLAIHVVELPKFNRPVLQLTQPFESWCYFLRHGEELDNDHLPATLQMPAIQKAMEVLRMLTQSDLEREKYEARLKYQRDEAARMQHATELGEQRGVERGTLMGRVQVFEELLGQQATPAEALHAMPLDQLRQLADSLQAQVKARR